MRTAGVYVGQVVRRSDVNEITARDKGVSHGRQHRAEKLVQPQISFIAEVPDVGVDRYQIDTRVFGHICQCCFGSIEHVVFHTPCLHTADIESMHEKAVFDGPWMTIRVG